MADVNAKIPIYKNPNYTIEHRIADLLEKMTLREKVRQLDQYIGTTFMNKTYPNMQTVMADDAEILWEKVEEIIGEDGIGCIHDLYGFPEVNNALQKYAVENTRLGIPILFSEEALHGLARPYCSVFPHAITMASTWNPEIVQKIGECIAAETRSLGIHETFGPVLDLARDPRWGRTEETYGEDTYLSSRMGVAMVKGLQGDNLASDSTIIAEPKHFAVHGIPEGGLNTSPCSIGFNEMFTYHLPIFEAAFKEGGAVNAMCSYNSIDGTPCSAHRYLLTDVLRDQWGMPGFVRSDLGAIARLQHTHCTASNEKEAIRQALEAGTDMQYYDYSNDTYQSSIMELINDGTLNMEVLNTAVSRVLRVKFMLGLFEKPYTDAALYKKVIRSEKHGDVALKAAREGICLLKNEEALLPLNKNISKIAVIGPSAAVERLGDYTPAVLGFECITILQGIMDTASKETKVTYVKGTGILQDELEVIPKDNVSDGSGNQGLFAEYFNNTELQGVPAFTRVDEEINFNWIIARPDERITVDHFSVRWTGKLVPKKSFRGSLGTASQDSMRLWIDGLLVIDGWGQGKSARGSISFDFQEDKEYEIRLEYAKDNNGSEVLFGWNLGDEEFEEAVEAARVSDVAIVALGDSQRTCGEGIDRYDLNLPGKQLELLKAVYATGTPVVLVLQNGRAITMNWEAAHIPAIIEAWYPGEKGGKAIAEVIFGEYNPAGRIPVTFPKSTGHLPLYYNRRRGSRNHYSDGDNKPLFAFGHGLSYTTFQYENIQLDSSQISAEDKVNVTFDVVNTGNHDGDEVVQLYICDMFSSIVRPEKELKKFKRIHLKAGEKCTLTFEITPKDLQLLGSDFKWRVESGTFKVMIGPSSDIIALRADFEVV